MSKMGSFPVDKEQILLPLFALKTWTL